MSLVNIDITGFLRNPVRTGIQRVVREILVNWPADKPMRAVYLSRTEGRFICVPMVVIDYLVDCSNNPFLSEAQISATVTELTQGEVREYADVSAGETILCPEIFVDQHRSHVYDRLVNSKVRLAFVIIDFIPWLHPSYFGIVTTGGLNWYIESLVLGNRRCFISAKVKRDYETRISRRGCLADPVITLGADGFDRVHHRSLGGSRDRSVICFGSLDGRKGQDVVFDAFLQSSAAECLTLVFAGRVPDAPSPNLRRLLEYRGSNVKIVPNPDDQALARMISGARATVYASQQEGFGLPAIESLWFGTPVIVDASLPAVEDLPDLGQIRLSPASRENLTLGFNRLANDDEVSRLTTESSRIKLNRWADYGLEIAKWVTDA